jgi:hypothetical protein
MAVSGAGRAYVYNGTWTATGENAGQPLIAVSCTSSQFCMTIDASGHEMTYSSGTWSARYQYSQAGTPTALSCYTYLQPVTTRSGQKTNLAENGCMVGFSGGRVASYKNGTWDPKVMVDKHGIVALSCTDQSWCLAATGDNKVVAWAGPQGKWEGLRKFGPNSAVTSLSCASQRFCVAVDNNGDAFVGTSA